MDVSLVKAMSILKIPEGDQARYAKLLAKQCDGPPHHPPDARRPGTGHLPELCGQKGWLKVSPSRALSPTQRAVLVRMNQRQHKT